MDKDATHDITKSYDVIKEIGKSIYNTRKPTKGKEVRIKARDAMRRMTKLVAATECVERAAELFLVQNYYELEDTILDMCGMKWHEVRQTKGWPDGWHTDPKHLKDYGCGPYCTEQIGERGRSRKIPGDQSELC